MSLFSSVSFALKRLWVHYGLVACLLVETAVAKDLETLQYDFLG